MPHPFLFAKIQTSNPGRKSDWHPVNSPAPLEFGVTDRNPSLYMHSNIGNRYRNVSHHPFFSLAPQHYTRHSGLDLLAPSSNISFRWFLTSLTIGGGICLKCSLNGVSSVTLMVYSVEWVHPSSTMSNKNTS